MCEIMAFYIHIHSYKKYLQNNFENIIINAVQYYKV